MGMTRRLVASISVSVIVFGLGAAALWKSSKNAAAENRKSQESPSARPVSVQVARAKRSNVRVVLSGLGTVVPLRSVTVRSRVAGQLLRVAYREGELVKEGQLLAELDPRPFQARVAQAEGQLLRDRALLENARIELERARAMAQDKLLSTQQVLAQQSLVEQHRGTEQASLGALAAAQLELGFTRITAPIRGRIGFRLLDVGNNVTPANDLALINEVDPIAVIFSLSEDQVQTVFKRLQSGDKDARELPVEAWDKGNRSLLERGKLLTIDNQIDQATGTVRLKAQFQNEQGRLFPSQFVNVRFDIDELAGVVVVPQAAVQRGREGAFVYVVGPTETVEVRKVVLGPVESGSVVVEQGLSSDERVVVAGADQIREGSRARAIEKPPRTTPSP